MYRSKKSWSRVAVTPRRLSGPCRTGHLDPPIMPRKIPSGNGGVITAREYNSGEHQILYMICAYPRIIGNFELPHVLLVVQSTKTKQRSLPHPAISSHIRWSARPSQIASHGPYMKHERVGRQGAINLVPPRHWARNVVLCRILVSGVSTTLKRR
jgi:hypothetical protein